MYYGQAFLQLAVMQLFGFQISYRQIGHMELRKLGTEGGHRLWGPGQVAPCPPWIRTLHSARGAFTLSMGLPAGILPS